MLSEKMFKFRLRHTTIRARVVRGLFSQLLQNEIITRHFFSAKAGIFHLCAVAPGADFLKRQFVFIHSDAATHW